MQYGRFWAPSEYFTFKGDKLPILSRGYWVAQRTLIMLAYSHYYTRFEDHGWENVPVGKPIIFAISHRNAFMDSLAFVNVHNTQVWQLARGDAFKNPMLKKLFYFFHMLPIWRERDGVDTKQANQDTFEACADILAGKGMVGIYPEGNCVNERYIRPLKKGICRIAFGAMEKYDWDIDLQIVPVGVSYKDATSFKGTQLINFGKPIAVSIYKEEYKSNPVNAINSLKEVVEAAMQETVVHIPKSIHHAQIDNASVILGAGIFDDEKGKGPLFRELQGERKAVETLLDLEENNGLAFADILHSVELYTKKLRSCRMHDRLVRKGKLTFLSMLAYAGGLLIGLPVFLAGVAIHIIPAGITERLVKRSAGQSIFLSSLRYAFGLIVFFVWYLLCFFVAIWLLPVGWWALPFVFILPFLGSGTWWYVRHYKDFMRLMRSKAYTNRGPFAELIQHRKKLDEAISFKA